MDKGTSMKVLLKEYKELNHKSLYDNQAYVEFEEDNPFLANIILTPNGGPYAETKITFYVVIPTNYPLEKISVKCKSKIYHPNINDEGKVCLNILSSDWTQDLRIEHYINGLLFLLYNPNLDSLLSSYCSRDMTSFLRNVRIANAGGTIDGRRFGRILVAEPIIQPRSADIDESGQESVRALISKFNKIMF